MPTRTKTVVGDLTCRRISATRAMMPPSPWLSARRISSTYLSVTIRISDQKISEIAPYTCRWSGRIGWSPAKISCTV